MRKTGSCCSTSPILRVCPISSSRAPRAVAADRGHPGKYAVTLSRSSVEPFLQFSGAPRSARDRVPRLDRARRKRRRERQSRHRRRIGALESRARPAFGLRDLRSLPPRRHDGENASSRARSPGVGLDARRRQRAQRGRGAASDRGKRRRQFQTCAVGLALSRGEAAQGRVRLGRERAQALSAARPHHRRGVLRREPPVRR